VSNRCTFNYPKDWWSVGVEPEVRTSCMRQPALVGAHRTLGIDHYWLHRIAVQKSNGMRFLRRKLVTGLLLEDRLRRKVLSYDGPPDAVPWSIQHLGFFAGAQDAESTISR